MRRAVSGTAGTLSALRLLGVAVVLGTCWSSRVDPSDARSPGLERASVLVLVALAARRWRARRRISPSARG